ncbi:MAG: NAD-dependent epimerase/dehydratase family protein [Anaerolineales bacterium]|nr:NAD-dependent epimerase/dehydratase family protein [Anaerolineales bacterium]
MKILVTGGAGFIGSHLVAALIQRGNEVRVLDNLSSGKHENLDGLPVELVVGDIRNWETVRQAVNGCDLVFHQAALVSVPRSLAEPQLNHDVNVNGAFHVFEAARQAGIKRVVYASSAAVYGDTPSLPASEHDRSNPMTPYAAAKLMNEEMATVYNHSYGREFVGLRYFNVFGPRQDPSSPYSGVLSVFCRATIANSGVTIYGDGKQTRDFVYVSDVVVANLAAADWAMDETHPVFNVGRGEQTDLLQILEMLRQQSGVALPVQFTAARAGDIRDSCADVTAVQSHLNYTPHVSIAAGLQKTLNWFV